MNGDNDTLSNQRYPSIPIMYHESPFPRDNWKWAYLNAPPPNLVILLWLGIMQRIHIPFSWTKWLLHFA